MNENNNYKERVKAAKERLLNKEIRNAKTKFLDFLGPKIHTEHTRLENLWAERISDRRFTEQLEAYEAQAKSDY